MALFTKFDIIGLGNLEFSNLALSVNLVILPSNGKVNGFKEV